MNQTLNQTTKYPLDTQHLQQGLTLLKKRQNKLSLLALLSSTVGIVGLITVFMQQDIVFGLFGLSLDIKQIHIPYAVDEQLREFIHQPDYFLNAFSWFAWLILKVIVSFIGAFFIISILKKFKYFLFKFQSFVLKFVAWLLAFILLWSGVTYVQYDLKDDENSEIASFIQYDQNIQQSEIYTYLQQADSPDPVKHYLLAQTALLHKPEDKTLAKVYAEKLLNDEKTDRRFQEYGFKSEQIWTIQHQVYGHSVSNIAKTVDPQMNKAIFWSNIAQNILWVITVLSFLISIIIYFLAHRIKQRLIRIDQQIFHQ